MYFWLSDISGRQYGHIVPVCSREERALSSLSFSLRGGGKMRDPGNEVGYFSHRAAVHLRLLLSIGFLFVYITKRTLHVDSKILILCSRHRVISSIYYVSESHTKF